MCTGGQFKLAGSHAASFTFDDSEHRAILSWGQASRHRFPYQLQIDDLPVDDAQVEVENWRMGYIPLLCLAASTILIFIIVRSQ